MCSPELNNAVDNLEEDISHLDYAVNKLIQANTELKKQLDESNRLLEIYRSVARAEDN